MKGGQECQFSGLCPQRAHCRTIVRTLPHITIVDTMPHITILYHPSPSPVTCELPNINRGIPTTLPLPVLSCKLQNINDLYDPCPQIFFTATCYFPPCRFGSSELKCIPHRNTRCALIFVARVGVPDPALFTRWNMFGARWCTSAVTKAEIRPRAPQLWHKLGAKKYCWQDPAVFQRRFEKKID